MDISAIVWVLVLTALALGAVIWMEINSGSINSQERSHGAIRLGLDEE